MKKYNGAIGRYKKVYIEITNICNLRCDFCPSTRREQRYMDKDNFLQVVHQIKPFTQYVYFHLMGEPLLHPELDSFLRICGENGLKVNITTNGTLLQRVKDVLLSSPSLRKVSISLHSFEANEGDGGTVKIEKYMAGIVDFVEAASQKGIISELRLWNEDDGSIRASNSRNGDILEMIQRMPGIGDSIETTLEQTGSVKLRDYIFISKAQKFEWPDMDRAVVDEEVFCYGLRDQFGILVDGTVVPCCLDSEGNIPLGNIFLQPLKDILASERALAMYHGFSGRKAVEELCQKCGYAKRHKRTL